MTDDQHRQDIDRDRLLNQLVRAARDDADYDFVRPSDSTVTAYLLGEADDKQRQEVTEALIASVAFRSEILELSTDLESLASPKIIQEFASLLAELSPDQAQSDTTLPTRPRISFLARLRDLVWPSGLPDRVAWLWKGAIPVTAAILLAVFSPQIAQWAGLGWGQPTVAKWHETGVMDPGLFVSNVPRDATPRFENRVSASHLEAAQSEFSRAILYTDGQFLIRRPDTRLTIDGPLDTIVVVLAGDDGQLRMTAHSVIPSDLRESARLWSVTATDRQLRKLALTADTVTALWLPEYGRRGCLTITYPSDSGFTATSFVVFDL